MNKIDAKLKEIRQRKKIGLMTHVVVGYPSLDETVMLVKHMEKSGVDMVELQIPFSDPLADGPTIMHACEIALQNGTRVKDAFSIMHQLTKEVSIPLLFMAYYNTVFTYGIEKFCKDAARAGASGVIVPDMPIDEEKNEHFYSNCKKYSLHAIHIVSSVSPEIRLRKNARAATGFLYATARQGITGAKGELVIELTSYLDRLKQVFKIPLAVGFGISKKEHIAALTGKADVAIVGSAIIDVINSSSKTTMQENVKKFLQKLI